MVVEECAHVHWRVECAQRLMLMQWEKEQWMAVAYLQRDSTEDEDWLHVVERVDEQRFFVDSDLTLLLLSYCLMFY